MSSSISTLLDRLARQGGLSSSDQQQLDQLARRRAQKRVARLADFPFRLSVNLLYIVAAAALNLPYGIKLINETLGRITHGVIERMVIQEEGETKNSRVPVRVRVTLAFPTLPDAVYFINLLFDALQIMSPWCIVHATYLPAYFNWMFPNSSAAQIRAHLKKQGIIPPSQKQQNQKQLYNDNGIASPVLMERLGLQSRLVLQMNDLILIDTDGIKNRIHGGRCVIDGIFANTLQYLLEKSDFPVRTQRGMKQLQSPQTKPKPTQKQGQGGEITGSLVQQRG